MLAAWYERKGPAAEVLTVGELDDPVPGPGELRIRLEFSGISVGDVKKRQVWLGAAQMPYPRVVPHSDGAGVVDAVGAGVDRSRVGRRVWCYRAQSYRPFGTAAQYTVVPASRAVPLPAQVTTEQGACLGIPGLTAHRAVFADGPVRGRTVLVTGGVGAVGRAAVALARRDGARVIATVRHKTDLAEAEDNGADHALLTGGGLAEQVCELTGGEGVDRVIEIAFGANVALDAALLAQGGVLVSYATDDPQPRLPFWELLFKNVTVRLLGSDDFPESLNRAAADDLSAAAAAGDLRFPVAEVFPLERIAAAHQAVERPAGPGRVLVALPPPD
ncbi:NADPH:quinone reductase [Streptomyces sp. H27-D2]|uniref:NADPH:quinone reductase n=1 Tax=Streptomyces sp. H27-D2 TaxID=3046304 RepID=UPI002DBE2C4D|nr:NADPH:quinone reductase [Streptomyces sp. H27-D2]MEC4015771.1 NADPH:quinone reductase [Streptomyces sp. H27-D2]